MWTQTTVNTNEINSATPPIDYLADAVNKLSFEDFQRFQSRVKRSFVGILPDTAVNDADGPKVSIDQLTRREHEVLVLVASGYSRKEIGTALRISENTAASHIASIYRKLEICSIAEATNIAIRVGVI